MQTELSDGAILVRPYRREDIDATFEAASASIDEVFPWLPWCRPGYTRDEAESWIVMQEKAWAEGTSFEFAIFDGADGGYIGGCGINQINRLHRFANLGYWVRSDATRRGVATAATRLVARFGFEQLDLNRIEILAAVGNLASQRVAEKAGATREGVLRRRLLLHGVAHDAVLTSLVPDDVL